MKHAHIVSWTINWSGSHSSPATNPKCSPQICALRPADAISAPALLKPDSSNPITRNRMPRSSVFTGAINRHPKYKAALAVCRNRHHLKEQFP